MKQQPKTLRTAAFALFASAAFLNAPVFGQDVPVVAPPPPVQAAPPAPLSVAPPAVTPAPRAAPAEPARAAPVAPRVREAARTAPRPVERVARTATGAAPAAPAASVAPAAEPPTPLVTEAVPAPAEQPAPPVAETASETATASEGASPLPWLIAAGVALIGLLAGLMLLRRRRRAETEYHGAPAYEEPAMVEEPVAPVADAGYQPPLVTPAFRRPEPVHEPEVMAAATGLALQEADRADVAALAAASTPEGHRPWLEFLMRPVRAGTTDDEALVEFELTVGNTGTVAAEDVRISTWMLAGAGSEAESALIEPPSSAATSETRIAPGDGAKVDASIALPRARLKDDVLPVVVADARYRLPGGGEGRTSARFAVGLPSGDGLAPFAVALGQGLREDVEARLEGEPQRA